MWATVAIRENRPPTPWSGSPIISIDGCQIGENGSKWVWSKLNIHRGNDMEKMEEQWQVMKSNDM